jgi:hypothetical protein
LVGRAECQQWVVGYLPIQVINAAATGDEPPRIVTVVLDEPAAIVMLLPSTIVIDDDGDNIINTSLLGAGLAVYVSVDVLPPVICTSNDDAVVIWPIHIIYELK